jgi:predicted outer membrane protein
MVKDMDEFYIEKFMEIQRQNVVLSNLLRDIAEDANLRKLVEDKLGEHIFDILKDTPA